MGSIDACYKPNRVNEILSLTINTSVTVSPQLEYSEKVKFLFNYLLESSVSHQKKAYLYCILLVGTVDSEADRKYVRHTLPEVSQLVQSAVNVSSLMKWDDLIMHHILKTIANSCQ